MIFVLSHEVASDSTARSDVIVGLLHGAGLDWATELVTVLVRKSAHFVAYAILGGLFYLALSSHALRRRDAATIAVMLSFLYAVSDEIHQVFVPGRSGEVGDVLLDSLGALVGVVIIAVLVKALEYRSGAVLPPDP